MIIKIGFYKRKPGISAEEFRHWWSEVYGPSYRKYPDVGRHIIRYVHHRLSPSSDDPETILPYDGFSETWFENEEAQQALMAEPDWQKHIAPIVDNFLDYENSKVVMLDSQVYQVGGPPDLDKRK